MRYLISFLLLVVGAYYFIGHDAQVEELMNMHSINKGEKPGIKLIIPDADRYDILDALVPGHITVLYFASDSCQASKTLGTHFVRFLNVRPDVAVRKFDLGFKVNNDDAINTYRLHIGKTPFILIYGPYGQLISKDDGLQEDAFDLLYKWINAELEEDRVENYTQPL